MDETYTVKNVSLTDSTPDRLFDICANYVVDNIKLFCNVNSKYYIFRDGSTVLPREICEKLLECSQVKGKTSDAFIGIFSDKRKTRLKKVSLRNSNVSHEALKVLLSHELQELYLYKCDNLTLNSFDAICLTSQEIIILEIDIPLFIQANSSRQKCVSRIFAPHLKQLSIRWQEVVAYPNLLLNDLPSLTHLDFSECSYLNNISSVQGLKHLRSLILYNVPRISEMFDWICHLKTLEHLDISQASETTGVYVNSNHMLSRLIQSLPKLTSLDISGTNLAGNGVAEPKIDKVTCDIPGLVKRVNRPLEFLGLYGTWHAASSRHDIPALKIAGDSNKEQIFTAAVAYLDKQNMFIRVLNDLFHLCRSEKEEKSYIAKILFIILEGMKRHTLEKQVQISGSAILFYLVKDKNNNFGLKLRQKIITTIICGMANHLYDYTVMRNGCLTILNFNIPNDVLFDYKKLALILLHCISSDRTPEGLVQRLAISLLNSMACQVDERHKTILGECGIVTKMLNIISNRLRRNLCDEVLQVAWSTLWNVTDETHSNCALFIHERGLDFFLDCLKYFPYKDELLRNMMGLLGNIAEVQKLRMVFMTKGFLTVFSELLDSDKDGIEVSYNAAGVIAHIASDGPDCWPIRDPQRQIVLDRMTAAINRWDINSERNIHYRSFGPILGLLAAYHTPESVHWALWALANLTTVYPDKYCRLLMSEDGINLLQNVIERQVDPYVATDNMKSLARLIIDNCETYVEKHPLEQ